MQIRECLKCKEEFESRNIRSVHCPKHRQNAFNPVEKRCKQCGKRFFTNKSTKVYCEAECQLEANKPKNQYIVCEHCGNKTKKFPQTGQRGGRRFWPL